MAGTEVGVASGWNVGRGPDRTPGAVGAVAAPALTGGQFFGVALAVVHNSVSLRSSEVSPTFGPGIEKVKHHSGSGPKMGQMAPSASE